MLPRVTGDTRVSIHRRLVTEDDQRPGRQPGVFDGFFAKKIFDNRLRVLGQVLVLDKVVQKGLFIAVLGKAHAPAKQPGNRAWPNRERRFIRFARNTGQQCSHKQHHRTRRIPRIGHTHLVIAAIAVAGAQCWLGFAVQHRDRDSVLAKKIGRSDADHAGPYDDNMHPAIYSTRFTAMRLTLKRRTRLSNAACERSLMTGRHRWCRI